jgi:hypothetical protein
MPADVAIDVAEPPPEDEAVLPGDRVLGAPEHELTAATIGKSSSRRALGIVGQYAALVVLAALVLVPIAFTVIQALSPPFRYFDAGKPLHPVAVEWKDKAWLDGGAFSVVARTLVVALALAWIQLRAGGGHIGHLAPLASPRRVVAVVAGVVAVAAFAGQIWQA